MKILFMTATFGKLSQQTLALKPGMNIIEAPNEWGKSTWCAFLMAMLYGIDTGSRSKTGFLADKEHYAPWSGEPMSGRMDILWNGREITIERQNKNRIPMGEVKAFETKTGIPVPELAVAMPGQVLLGVERSVFARAGFLKLSEMPVTEDESLRRRLNELVTTGDESGASDDLAQKLRNLKNKCRFNKKGLLPELEIQQAENEKKRQQLESLQYNIRAIKARQQELEEQSRLLENHKQALQYAQHQLYAQKLTAAQVQRDTAKENLLQGEKELETLPSQETIRQELSRLQQLRDTKDSLHTRSQLLPQLPPVPEATAPFRGKDPAQAVAEAISDAEKLQQMKNPKGVAWWIFGGLCLAVAVALFLLSQPVIAGVALLCGAVCFALSVARKKKLQGEMTALTEKYAGIPVAYWEQESRAYAAAQQNYNAVLADRQQKLADLNRELEENTCAIAAITGEMSLSQYEELCRSQLQIYTRLQEKQSALQQAEDVLQALSGAGEQVLPPQFADTLTYSAQETEHYLTANAAEQQLLHQRLGQSQGQMETLGSEESLLAKKQQLESSIEILEQYYRALTRAQETLVQATQELQRRFAPKLSQRAQELFGRMTGQRYRRLSLCQDLSVEAGAEGENTLRGTLWRSDGTVDQLYLALRLAVAEELTPNAPLVLDDALVRFDDTRLASALEILREASENKQVILFTCQGREQEIITQTNIE